MGWKVKVVCPTLTDVAGFPELWLRSYIQDSLVYSNLEVDAGEFTDLVDLKFLERHCQRNIPDFKFQLVPVLRIVGSNKS